PVPEDTFLARPATTLLWTVDNYGPLYIPLPGDTIHVTNANYKLYKNIPGIQLGKNILKEKLYFVMGDNRHRAEDSRYIGFIPHSNMYGIVK
ncbi:MAG TPA: S26 family signal peptidase, partial [Chitinophagaceae bacterium]|nr:S26 family signal peptidase [Chitinophagaceae bacterium]